MRAWLSLLRPHQWIKNSLVWVGLLYSNSWTTALPAQISLITLAFCSLSSAVYIYNDYHDRAQDAQQPHKKHRPLANGQVSLRQARYLGLLLLGLTSWMSCYLPWTVKLILISYLALNIAYTHYLKWIALIDIFTIAFGFMLRLLAGTWAIGIIPSAWLLFCSSMLMLFLGFCKRRLEPMTLKYNPQFLDVAITITASCCMVSYGLYALNPLTQQIHHTAYLIYTEPLVIYGILRYLYRLYQQPTTLAEDMAKALWQDPHLWITLVAWVGLTLYLLT